MANTKKTKVDVANSMDSMLGVASSLNQEEAKESSAPKEKKTKYHPEQKKFLLRYSPDMEKQLLEIAKKFADDTGVNISTNQIIVKALREFIKKYGD